MSKSVVRMGRKGKGVESVAVGGPEGQVSGERTKLLALDTRVALIQALIPIGLEAVNEVLQREVCQLAGERYSREGGVDGYARWGGQRGSVYLADQKVAIQAPRVRDTRRGQEVPLSAYQALQNPRRADDASLRKILKGLSCRDYEPCVDAVSETFGLSSSSMSRRFKRASAKKLAELAERDLSGYDVVGLFLDGKTFGDDTMVIALGVTIKGEKVVLGFVQTATENERVCSQFLRSLAVTELWERSCRTADERNWLLDQLGAEGLTRRITYTNAKGEDWTYTLGDMVLPVCNHGMHHRVQALNMLRHTGVKTPGLDYLFMRVDPSPSPPRFAHGGVSPIPVPPARISVALQIASGEPPVRRHGLIKPRVRSRYWRLLFSTGLTRRWPSTCY